MSYMAENNPSSFREFVVAVAGNTLTAQWEFLAVPKQRFAALDHGIVEHDHTPGQKNVCQSLAYEEGFQEVEEAKPRCLG